ncbi:MAG: hypothetical protein NT155_02265 [Candidatus Staskawiczbacteria bacterium]|nr:hypothetical protein [Candidatus Staskawiczbacteria bacterium]
MSKKKDPFFNTLGSCLRVFPAQGQKLILPWPIPVALGAPGHGGMATWLPAPARKFRW